MKRLLMFTLISFLMLYAIGCQKDLKDSLNETQNSASHETGEKEYGEITDTAKLEDLWQEYFYGSSNLVVGISGGFNNAKEIDPDYIAQFCWQKYKDEHDTDRLEPSHEGSGLRLFPLETALEYAKRYFDLDDINISEISEGVYDTERRAFLFSVDGKRKPPRPSYKGYLGGKRLEKVTRNEDNTITALLAKPSYKSDFIEYTDTYILKERPDGSLFFKSGKREYINNNLVSISGDYESFDKIIGFDGNLQELSMLGETDEKVILAYTPYEKNKTPALMVLNPKTMAIEKKIQINGEFEATDINLRDGSIIIRLSDRVLFVTENLGHQEEIPLPRTITEKINREPLYDNYYFPLTFFGGYDISNDKKRYVYADEVGLKLLDTTDGSESLILKTVPIPDSELIKSSYHYQPRFIVGESKVITTMTAYEGSMGFTTYDFNENIKKHYDIRGFSVTGYIRYDTGLLEINTYIRDDKKQTGDYKTLYLDFASGQIKEIYLEDSGDTGYIVMPSQYYIGKNHAAFITINHDSSNYLNNKYHINILNLKTLQAKAKVSTIKAADTNILGVLADGRILFCYDLNPSENGICITK